MNDLNYTIINEGIRLGNTYLNREKVEQHPPDNCGEFYKIKLMGLV